MNILVADDERAALSLVNKAIRKALPEEEPVCFSNVSEALAYAGQISVDVAFLDIEMGNISGLVLAKELYKIKPDTNIIFVTGYTNYMDEAFELYASGYVRKPPRVERIQKEMANLRYQLLDSAISRQSKSVGAFTFDHTSQQVYKNGKDILLKPKEYKIFLLLADNPNIYFTPQELYERIYGMDYNGDIRTLYVHMSNLRKKLGLDDSGTERSVDIIQKRGKGYRFVIVN